MEFNIGDRIVYPMHGAGVIESIEESIIMGEKKRYYILKIPVGNMSVMIPMESAEKIGIREVISEKEADKVLKEFENCPSDATNNWNKRYRENLSRIKSGNIFEIVGVCKCLMVRDKSHGLSTGERKMLANVKQIIISELVIAKKTTQQEIEKLLNSIIDKLLAWNIVW